MTCHVAHTCRKSRQRNFLIPARLSAFLQALVLALPIDDGRDRTPERPASASRVQLDKRQST